VGTSPTDTLEAIQNAPHSAWLWREAARTGEDGRFELDGLAPSPQYILLVVQEGLAPRVLWAPAGASGTRTDLGEIELVPCGGLFGRAVFADGTPAAGETLHLQRVVRVEVASAAELGRWRPDSWFQVLETVAGADGGFRFDLLAPGSYEFLSVASGSAEVVPETTSEVSGVVQSEAGDPIPLVFVRAIVGNGTSERLASASLVDAHGAFSLPVPADSVARLAFTHLHGVYEERDVLVGPADRTAPLVIVLMERARHLPALDGLVLGPRGDPLEGSAVTLHPPEDSLCACISFQARTDSAGSFRFEVSEGPHRLVATDPRFASATYAPAWPGDHVLIDLDDP
jgi:hypothetical protein